MSGDGLKPSRDVRLRGFADRVAVAEALRWIDAEARRLDAEEIAVGEAAGRVLAAPVTAVADAPPQDRAAIDGFAVRAGDSLGAGDYDPVILRLAEAAPAIAPGHAVPVAAGAAWPPGADAVLPFEQAQAQGNRIEVFAPVAAGAGIARRGQEARAGAVLLDAGHVLRPGDPGLLAALGIGRVAVVRRPRVRLVVAGAKGAGRDANGPIVSDLAARDGGLVTALASGVADQAAIARELATPGADAILVTGRSGTGEDDVAPLALAETGDLAIHGIALRPGGSTGLGRAPARGPSPRAEDSPARLGRAGAPEGGVPVILLPGEPLACLAAYELFAGRLLRGLGGRGAAFPHRICEVELAGKIVSIIGFVEFRLVRLAGGGAEPLAAPEGDGLVALLHADGFVVVPAPLEGYAPGTRIRVHLFGERAETR
ncbi:MAG TPA: molybdopterin-binding protein [Stellaceae bacterium]|nr:molybdopterin-binding protein [Stellaceae bacterium]